MRPSWVTSRLALPALGVVALWASFGFVLVLLLAGAQHIPKDLYDQARVDGAGAVREFLAVTLPGLRLRGLGGPDHDVHLRAAHVRPAADDDAGRARLRDDDAGAHHVPDVFGDGLVGEGAAIAVVLTIMIFVGVMTINRVVARD